MHPTSETSALGRSIISSVSRRGGYARSQVCGGIVAAATRRLPDAPATGMLMRIFPKSRMDALTDGIFAFAMTLLVLEIRLPAGLPIRDAGDLLAHVQTLWPEYLAYVISFVVLATQWRANIELRHAGEHLSLTVVRLWLVYLFFITGVPFSCSIVGHYGYLAPAVWLYAANIIVVAAISLPLRSLEVAPEHNRRARVSRTVTLIFIASALASVAISLVEPSGAMFAYLLNGFARPLANWRHGPEGAA